MRRWKTTTGVLVCCLCALTVFVAALAAVEASNEMEANTGTVRSRQTRPATPVEESDSIFRLYLAVNGSDDNSGLAASSPLRTLARAQEMLVLAAPQSDVEIRIKQGTYIAPPTRWTFLVPGHRISFLPSDYDFGEGIDDIAARPVFRGDGTSGYWFTGALPRDYPGGDAGLRFYYLQVERYDLGGLKLSGGIEDKQGIWRPATTGHNGNLVVGMYFTKLGSKWAAPRAGFGGIDLINSRSNVIRDNHFVRLENAGSDAHLMHGVYLAHGSSRNVVRGNYFQAVSGDPIRTRNDSNDNNVFNNVLQHTGDGAQYSEWFCDGQCAKRHSKPRECASHGNLFHDNNNVSGYPGSPIKDWHLAPGDQAYAGGASCGSDGKKRIRTWGNR